MSIAGQNVTTAKLAAVRRIEEYLLSRDDTFGVMRAEESPKFAPRMCDLVWYWVNLKTEKTSQFGIYVWAEPFERDMVYLERTRGNESGLAYSRADYVFYYYMTTNKLCIVPMQELLILYSQIWTQDTVDVAVSSNEGTVMSTGYDIPKEQFLKVKRLQNLVV
jgi:hypothetical protein